ncbi:TIR domain-containing protein, partial [Haloferula sp. A504]|uniref:toll/interleukin-1 receptor domain-containing protein n=1 Tax=Haloferula sp. A504 TaxID=3373601 RepID=UPI0031C7A165|nr:TIR domain-containing protein [Verrucomicrobiaceae bacterium E54]
MDQEVFVSYSSKNRETADMVCAALEAAGMHCWIAHRNIRPAADWAESIIEAIDSSQLMVLILSEGANASDQVKREVARAVSQGVAILPLRIEDVRPSKSLDYYLSTAQWMDAWKQPVEEQLELLVAAVKPMLKRTAADVSERAEEEAARKVEKDAARRAKEAEEESARQAKEEAARQAREQAALKAKEEAARKAQAKRKAQEEREAAKACLAAEKQKAADARQAAKAQRAAEKQQALARAKQSKSAKQAQANAGAQQVASQAQKGKGLKVAMIAAVLVLAGVGIGIWKFLPQSQTFSVRADGLDVTEYFDLLFSSIDGARTGIER